MASEPVVEAGEAPIGAREVFALSFGTIVGIVWVFLLADWLRAAGPVGSAVAIVVGALAMLPIVLCYAGAVRRFPGGGGEIRYALGSFGGRGGLVVALLLLLAYTALASFCVPLFQWLVEVTVRAASFASVSPGTIRFVAIVTTWATFGVIVTVNFRGIEAAAWLQNLTVVLLILLTVALGVTAAIIGHVANLNPRWGGELRPGRGIATVLATTPFLFAGFNTALQALGDTPSGGRDPRTIRALLASVLGAAVFYAGVVIAIPATLGRDALLALDLPALEAVGVALDSRVAVIVMGCLAGLALLTSWNALVFAASRVFGVVVESEIVAGRAFRRLGTAGHVGAIAIGSAVLSFAGRTAIGTLVSFVSLSMTLVFLVVALGQLSAERRASPASWPIVSTLGVMASVVLAVLASLEVPRSLRDSPLGLAVVVALVVAAVAIGARQFGRHDLTSRLELAIQPSRHRAAAEQRADR